MQDQDSFARARTRPSARDDRVSCITIQCIGLFLLHVACPFAHAKRALWPRARQSQRVNRARSGVGVASQ